MNSYNLPVVIFAACVYCLRFILTVIALMAIGSLIGLGVVMYAG